MKRSAVFKSVLLFLDPYLLTCSVKFASWRCFPDVPGERGGPSRHRGILVFCLHSYSLHSVTCLPPQLPQNQCCRSGPGKSICFRASRIRILLSASKNSKKNIDSYCFVTSLWLFIFEKWYKCTISSKSNKQKNIFCWRHEGQVTKIARSGAGSVS
jgi:hypothetical protein